MITFKRLEFKNFLLSGKNPIVIDLDQNFLTAIVGENGAGKSTFEDALCFALYGKAFRKINKPQLINSTNKKGLLVKLDLEVDGVPYTIIRGIKPNLFEIQKNGKALDNLASDREMQAYLESNILKMTESTFRQIVVLGSKAYIPFMRLNASQRRDVVENLFDIEVLSRMSDLVKEKVKQLKQRFQEIESKIQAKSNLLDTKLEHNAKIQESSQDIMRELQESIAEYEERRKALELEGKSVGAKLKKIEEEKPNIEPVLEEKKSLQPELYAARATIAEAEKKLKFYEKNDTCPTCSQPIDDKDKHVSDLVEIIEKAKKKKDRIELRLLEIEQEEERYSKWQSEIRSHKDKLSGLISEIKSVDQSISLVKKQMEREEKKASSVIVPESEIQHLKDEIESLRKKKASITAASKHYSFLQKQLKDDGIKARIVSYYLPLLNNLIQKYLDVMDFAVSFEFDSSFEETIKSRGREGFTYDSFSDGQKLRIDFALLMAFREIAKRKCSVQTNLLILDEIGDSSLDYNGFRALLDVLSLDRNQNVFIISHRPDILAGDADMVLSFYKEGKFSKMMIKE